MSLALEGVCETLGLRLTSVHPDRIVKSGAAWPGGSGSRRAGGGSRRTTVNTVSHQDRKVMRRLIRGFKRGCTKCSFQSTFDAFDDRMFACLVVSN